jgi:hypothetical protein
VTTTTTTTTPPSVTRCRDGYDKTHPAVRVVYQHGWLSTLWLLMGYTALPRRIDLVCPVCREVLGSIAGRRELSKFRYREPRPGER